MELTDPQAALRAAVDIVSAKSYGSTTPVLALADEYLFWLRKNS